MVFHTPIYGHQERKLRNLPMDGKTLSLHLQTIPYVSTRKLQHHQQKSHSVAPQPKPTRIMVFSMVLPMVFPWFSLGFPMVFRGFSHGFLASRVQWPGRTKRWKRPSSFLGADSGMCLLELWRFNRILKGFYDDLMGFCGDWSNLLMI